MINQLINYYDNRKKIYTCLFLSLDSQFSLFLCITTTSTKSPPTLPAIEHFRFCHTPSVLISSPFNFFLYLFLSISLISSSSSSCSVQTIALCQSIRSIQKNTIFENCQTKKIRWKTHLRPLIEGAYRCCWSAIDIDHDDTVRKIYIWQEYDFSQTFKVNRSPPWSFFFRSHFSYIGLNWIIKCIKSVLSQIVLVTYIYIKSSQSRISFKKMSGILIIIIIN